MNLSDKDLERLREICPETVFRAEATGRLVSKKIVHLSNDDVRVIYRKLLAQDAEIERLALEKSELIDKLSQKHGAEL